MPQLTYPIDPDGLIVPTMVGLDGDSTAALVSAGMPVFSPIQVQGDIDTASTMTAISSRLVTMLHLVSAGSKFTQTAAGKVPVNLYRISLSIVHRLGLTDPMFVIPSLLVMELTEPLPVDVLIGLDVFDAASLFVNGQEKFFSIFF